ncbi:MAG: RHS repeat protein, partial [bacterium]|nr:RHS repeat protein [bacterium]
WVHDNVDFDSKWGAFKGPLGTLWERSGTSWDQAWLLQQLLQAAGVDARFEWGEIQISTELLTNITGLDDPWRAGDLLTTAGVPIVLLVQGSQVIGARMSHVWIKAFVDYIPNRGVTPGAGDTWIRMDPSLKRYAYAPGIQIHDDVPFSLGDYLLSGTELSPRRAFEEALWGYIRANSLNCTNLEQLKKASSINKEGFPFLPGTLRGEIVQIDGEDAAMPIGFKERVRLEVRGAAGLLLVSWEAALPDLVGQRIDLVYDGATPADQAILESYGGVFLAPPFLVDLKPVVKVGGVEQATGSAIGSAEDVEVFVTLTPVGGVAEVLVHHGFAGEPSVLVTDFGRLPASLLEGYQAALLAAEAAGDEANTELARLQLIGSTYMHNLGRDLEDLVGWNWHRMVRISTEGLIAQTGTVTTTVAGEPLTFTRAETFVDVAGMTLGLFHTEGATSFVRPTLELAGAQGSFLEGEVFNQVIERQGIAAVSSLTRAVREGQSLSRVDGSNVDTILENLDLGNAVEEDVRSAVTSGRIAWVPAAAQTVQQWTGVGYILEDPETGAAAYLLSGGYAGGADVGPVDVLRELLGSEAWWTNGPLKPIIDAMLAILNALPTPEEPQTDQGDPVNVTNGNFWLKEVDVLLSARAVPVQWIRTYNSRSEYSGPMGYGWTFSYGEHLSEQQDGSVLFREDDGSEHLFELAADGSFIAPPGKQAELTRDAFGFTLEFKLGPTFRFAPEGRLLSVSDSLGNIVTLGYSASEQLETVTDASGRQVLTIESSDGKITRVEDFTGRQLTYTYEGDDLVSVRDLSGEVWSYAYDAEHNLLSRQTPLGTEDTYAYDSLDRCIRHTDRLGQTESFAYPDLGRKAVVTDRRGFDTFFEIDRRGRALTRVDALGNIARSGWDEGNNRVSYVDGRGAEWQRSYSASGDLLEETDPLGHHQSLTYDSVGHALSWTDKHGNTTTYEYDALGQPTRVSRPVGDDTLVEEVEFDGFGQLAAYRNANGKRTELEYDATTGVLVEQREPLNVTRQYDLDPLGRPVKIHGSAIGMVDLVWNDREQLAEIRDSFGYTVTAQYDALGRQTRLDSPRGVTLNEYDALDRLASSTDVLGNTTRFEYDTEGNLVATTDTLGRRTATTYDALGRPLSIVDALGGVWTFGQCADLASSRENASCRGGNCSRPLSVGSDSFCEVTNPLGNTTRREFDALGRVVRTIDAAGGLNELEYDAAGDVTVMSDSLGRETTFEYDDLGRTVAVTEANAARTEYRYDDGGQLTGILDANGHLRTFIYDAVGRLSSQSDALGNTTQMFYNPQGALSSKINARGQTIQFTYDEDRLLAIQYDGRTETYEYDVVGRRTSAANDGDTYAYSYDALGRLTQVENQLLGQLTTYEYDAVGNRTAMVGPAGRVVYLYDANDRLVELRDPSAGTFRFEYDSLGQRARLAYPNGAEIEYSYDALGQVETIVTRAQNGQVIDGFSYQYDAAGNRLEQASLRDGVNETFTYDFADRLHRWTRGDDFIEYSYDAVGNRLAKLETDMTIEYQYDAANRLLRESRVDGDTPVEVLYGWDADSNQISRIHDGSAASFSYDARGRLLQIDHPGGSVSYGYNPDGQRVRETDSSGDRLSQLDGSDVVAVFGQSGLEQYYTHGPAVDEPLAQLGPDGTHYLHHDALGSITSLSGPSGGPAGSARFRPFGEVEERTGASSSFAFAARELDSTSQYYFRARYYDPGAGRFTSLDPVGSQFLAPKTLNGFDYAFSNPVRFKDPGGNSVLSRIATAFLGIIVGGTILSAAWACVVANARWDCLIALGTGGYFNPVSASGFVAAVIAFSITFVLIIQIILEMYQAGEVTALEAFFLVVPIMLLAAMTAAFTWFIQAVAIHEASAGWAVTAGIALVTTAIFSSFVFWVLEDLKEKKRKAREAG